MDSSIVTLNVGGAHFCTTRDTILREPSSKLALLVRGILPATRDESGHLFLDRDARYFQCILNYLRDGWALLPASPAERRELIQEARYFQTGDEVYMPVSPRSSASPRPISPSTPVKPSELKTIRSGGLSPARSASFSPSYGVYARTTPWQSSCYGSPRITDLICRPACPPRCCSPCCRPICKPYIPPPLDDGYRWTSKYLRTNPKVREVVDSVLELAYMPPNCALTRGRVYVSIVSCPEGETYLANRYLVVKITGALGWTFEFTVRPTCDYCLYQKYNIAEYVQDNWFVLSAILRDQYGIVMEEDYCAEHSSILSKRYNLHISLTKPCC